MPDKNVEAIATIVTSLATSEYHVINSYVLHYNEFAHTQLSLYSCMVKCEVNFIEIELGDELGVSIRDMDGFVQYGQSIYLKVKRPLYLYSQHF